MSENSTLISAKTAIFQKTVRIKKSIFNVDSKVKQYLHVFRLFNNESNLFETIWKELKNKYSTLFRIIRNVLSLLKVRQMLNVFSIKNVILRIIVEFVELRKQ